MTEIVSEQVPKNSPIWLAWLAYKQTNSFSNTLKWAGENNLGALWSAFVAGYEGNIKDIQS